MSIMNYQNNSQIPVQAPPLIPVNSGGVLGANFPNNLGINSFGYNRANLYTNKGYNEINPYYFNGTNPHYFNTCFNGNIGANSYFNNEQKYQNNPRRFNHQNQRRRQQQQQQQTNHSRRNQSRRPRQLTINDFLPSRIREELEFDNEVTTPTNVTVPVNALPQRQHNRNNNNNNNNSSRTNETQPFVAQQQPLESNLQKAATTTSSFRCRQRRNKQQEYQQQNRNKQNNNRFAILATETDGERQQQLLQDSNDEPIFLKGVEDKKKKKKKKKKKNNQTKTRLYLNSNQIFNWFKDDVSIQRIIQSRGNQDYILASISTYDEWVRTDYEIQVWQRYLNLGIQNKHWAKEVVRRTKKRDDNINIRFIKKKINQLTSQIAQCSATISDLQIKLGNYWTFVPKQLPRSTIAAAATTTDDNTIDPKNSEQIRTQIDNLEKCILKYIKEHTQHVRKAIDNRILMAKVEAEEYKALEEFQQIASPSQWNIHLLLKPKLKTWSTKNKNYQTAMKRIEYNLPPRFIANLEFSYKIDESVLDRQEAQILYNKMQQLTNKYRTEAMTLYTESLAREQEILSHEVKAIIEGFPSTSDNQNDDPALAAFNTYHELKMKRLLLEVEQSLHFLDEQRVVGKSIQQQEEIIAPTHVRSLGPDFIIQIS